MRPRHGIEITEEEPSTSGEPAEESLTASIVAGFLTFASFANVIAGVLSLALVVFFHDNLRLDDPGHLLILLCTTLLPIASVISVALYLRRPGFRTAITSVITSLGIVVIWLVWKSEAASGVIH